MLCINNNKKTKNKFKGTGMIAGVGINYARVYDWRPAVGQNMYMYTVCLRTYVCACSNTDASKYDL